MSPDKGRSELAEMDAWCINCHDHCQFCKTILLIQQVLTKPLLTLARQTSDVL